MFNCDSLLQQMVIAFVKSRTTDSCRGEPQVAHSFLVLMYSKILEKWY